MKKNFYIIFKTLELGGIETLIVRLCNFLADRGHEVHFITSKKGTLTKLLPQNVKIGYFGAFYPLLIFAKINNFFIKKPDPNDENYIISFNPQSNFIAMSIAKSMKIRNFVTGVYHPQTLTKLNTGPNKKLYTDAFLSLNHKNIIAMNEGTKKQFTEIGYKNVFDIDIFPLPINIPPHHKVDYGGDLRIVSVGRLVEFKSYPIGIIRALRNMKKEGIIFHYHIYGEGSQKDIIKEEIRNNGLENEVELKGNIEYSKFHHTVSQYNLFVGMGTAAVEAASIGIPTLVALIDSPDKTYGFLHEQRGFSVGEIENRVNFSNLSSELKNIRTKNNRKKIGEKCKQHALKFSADKIIPGIFNRDIRHEPTP